MKIDRIMLAAPKSGSGKTTLTCGILAALKKRGMPVSSCKCGPDYIDPMFHRRVLGIDSQNLDTFFTKEEKTRELFMHNRREGETVLLEGVMGLFDGLGGICEEGSSYHLAQITRTPIVLVVDAKGMGRSLIPLLSGFLSYDSEKLIRGVILNQTSRSSYETIKPFIEELGIKALGYFPFHRESVFSHRHLGLVLPHELKNIQGKLEGLEEEIERTLDIEAFLAIAHSAEGLEGDQGRKSVQHSAAEREAPVIAVARDEAFCFYYEENLRLLEEQGAKLVFFSPLHDKSLPEGISGILLGGGYPELYAKDLSQNKSMLEEIKSRIREKIPTVAECGGFMYLHSALEDQNKRVYPMAGVLPGKCFFTGKLVRFGYIEVMEKESHFLPRGERIRGHEFHYFDSTDNGEDCRAIKPVTQNSYACVFSDKTCWLGFPHLYYPSHPGFSQHFVDMAAAYRRERQGKEKRKVERIGFFQPGSPADTQSPCD